MKPTLLSVKELAHELGVSVQSIRRVLEGTHPRLSVSEDAPLRCRAGTACPYGARHSHHDTTKGRATGGDSRRRARTISPRGCSSKSSLGA
jgi:hypothetical protein